jgi:hypothetical protein
MERDQESLVFDTAIPVPLAVGPLLCVMIPG